MRKQGPARLSENVPLRAGDVLDDKYVIEEVVGAGGVGVVFAAKHLGLDQRVAIKVLQRSALGSEETVTRFDREVKILARIRSEHVARVMDTGVLPSGEPFMVLELLEGEDLGKVLAERAPLPIERAVDIVAQACEGVAVAHALGVVHRDLKPANLFLTHGPDRAPVVKVLDFGISKLRHAEPAAQVVTQAVSVIGSPLYMSPELMETPRDADERSDVWSLGVILYELVAGKPPFEAPTYPLLCARICAGEPTPLQHHLSGVPRDLERVIARCLEKDKTRRFSSVAELARALAPFGSQGARAAAERSARIAEVGGASAVEAMQDEGVPESGARRWSWSSLPPAQTARRRSKRPFVWGALATTILVAVLAAARLPVSRPPAVAAQPPAATMIVAARLAVERSEGRPRAALPATPAEEASPAPEPTSAGPVAEQARPARGSRVRRPAPGDGATARRTPVPIDDILSER